MGTSSNKFTMTFASGLITDCKIAGDIVAGSSETGTASVDTPNKSTLEFEINADRKGQSSVADSWNAALANSPVHMNSYQLVGHNGSIPEKLNFYVPISMVIDGQPYDLLLGQGHYGSNNNWWLGSLNMYTVVQAKVGVNLLGMSFLMHKESGFKLLPSVNLNAFNSTNSMTVTNLIG